MRFQCVVKISKFDIICLVGFKQDQTLKIKAHE